MLMPPTLITGVSRRRARARSCGFAEHVLAARPELRERPEQESRRAQPAPGGNRQIVPAQNFGHGFLASLRVCWRPAPRRGRPAPRADPGSSMSRATAAANSRRILDFQKRVMLPKFRRDGREVFQMRPGDDGAPHAAGSSRLWPPRRASVPPMKTTSASGNRLASSPMESSSTTQGSAKSAATVSSVRRT